MIFIGVCDSYADFGGNVKPGLKKNDVVFLKPGFKKKTDEIL